MNNGANREICLCLVGSRSFTRETRVADGLLFAGLEILVCVAIAWLLIWIDKECLKSIERDLAQINR